MSTIELVRPMAAPSELIAAPIAPLTRRERVVLSNLSEDVTLEQIATKLFVTRNTVKSQVRSLYRKLGVSTRAEAVAWARAAGLR
ncbi:helix-turn-helix domain-containing protein [Cellulosimicrobium protaetiae]|uniref:Helix-turn-helix transcriptional regulator n=1 Tax=Cellulosimicrobium protaetiae TaxID=2587808 RepID=A0A6M5UD37_9MICO|nr:helix-turn-helix transcriptional regulator [Cellulosimicrobium protaetiae]QJW35115.1 helix-turn-helix transcriptional regulator [Cellulosimicrobium protaetiae]